MAMQPELGRPRSSFERFSYTARNVLNSALEEARKHNQNQVDTGHILLGLLGEPRIVRLLSELQIFPGRIKNSIEAAKDSEEKDTERESTLTPRTKKVIELAIDEAVHGKSTEITSIHLLIGIIREGQGIAARALEGRSILPLPTLLNRIRSFNPAKTIEDLRLEGDKLEIEHRLRQLETFLKDPEKDRETKMRIANIIADLMNIARKSKPKSNPTA